MANLVSKVLEELSVIAALEIEQEVKLVVGVDEEVEKLSKNFQAIKAVLADAEERQLKDAAIKNWLEELKYVSYDIDDVLDEWRTALLKLQIKGDHERASSKLKRQVCSFICSSCFYCSKVCLRHDIARKIKELKDRLDFIATEKERYQLKSVSGKEKLERPKATSFIDESEVVGKDQDKDIIENLLCDETESSKKSTPRIVSMLGMGGIGKTTLAKRVYNDNEVKSFFQERIWVCVSDPFDEIRIAKAILESLGSIGSQNMVELQTLLQHVCQSVSEKRFLLVMDDVWNDDYKKWEQLFNSLKCGSAGSAILVTTRKESVALSMRSTHTFPVRLLSHEDSWSLFSRIAFFGRTNRECKDLEKLGKEIINKCKGLPLAIKTLGSLLCYKKSVEEWENVLNSEIWELEVAKIDLIAPLWLSYYDLPPELRQCFSYCATFPKDNVFGVDNLIQFWMAQGYVRPTGREELETVGKEYFNILASRSFFQDFAKDEDDGSIVRCKMHDIIHDFAQFLTERECIYLGTDDLKKLSVANDPRKARHLCLGYSIETHELHFPKFKRLRSLFDHRAFVYSDNIDGVGALFEHLSCLRVLRLSSCGLTKVPSSIGKLIHIRLPHGFGNLVNLRHLLVSVTVFPTIGVERLSCLRTLDRFIVSAHYASNIGELGNLNHLRGDLEIYWSGDLKSPDDARKAQLKSKEQLRTLSLVFGGQGMVSNEGIEALEPSPNLEHLYICGCKGIAICPNWITSLSKLRRIALFDFPNVEHLPPLGKLPLLEELAIDGLNCVKKVGREFLGIRLDDNNSNEGIISTKNDKGEISSPLPSSSSSNIIIAFPKLKHLQFWGMKEWEEWDDDDDDDDVNIMPSLCSLSIEDCPKLKALPSYLFKLTTLEELTISNKGGILAKRFKEGEGEDWPKISHIRKIRVTNWEEEGDDMEFLRY